MNNDINTNMNEYEKLEKKLVTFYNHDGERYEGKVAGCEPGIGITIVNRFDPTDPICCLVGENSPLWESQFDLDRNKKYFNEIVKQIKTGVVDIRKILKKIDKSEKYQGKNVTQEDCAFAQ